METNRNFKILLGIACFVVAILPVDIAYGGFSLIGHGPKPDYFFRVGIIAVFGIILTWTGCFLISRRNSVLPKRTSTFLAATVIVAGLIAFLTVPTLKLAESYSRGGAAWYQMGNIARSIDSYEQEFGRLPFPTNMVRPRTGDFTFGTYKTRDAALGITNAAGSQANNGAIMAILLAWTNCPNFLRVSNVQHDFPRLDSDGVLLDPWGHPYIITLDMDADERCSDPFYKLAAVSEIGDGTNGLMDLVRLPPPPYQSRNARDAFEAPGKVLIWSFGPDGKVDSRIKADSGVNQDNILYFDQGLHRNRLGH